MRAQYLDGSGPMRVLPSAHFVYSGGGGGDSGEDVMVWTVGSVR